MREIVLEELEESASIKRLLAENQADTIVAAAGIIVAAYKAGKKVLLIGNGGSAADAQHIAAELVGRFQVERRGLAAMALTTNTSTLTAWANDYEYETVFSRQVEALASSGDVLIAITTSGTSPNVAAAVKAAKARGVAVIALTGSSGQLTSLADLTIMVPAENTPRIQEAHITVGHIICHLVERELFGEAGSVS